MHNFLTTLAALCALLPSAHAACSDHLLCGMCLSQEAIEEGCFWCYTDGKCKQATLDPLPRFDGCAAENVTMDAVNCECRPDVYTSCSECATATHPLCVWLEPGFEGQLSYDINAGPLLSTQGAMEPTVFSKGRCWSGMGFAPTNTEYNTSFKIGSATISTQYTITPTEGWYWAQCLIPKEGMAIVTIIVVLLGVCFLVALCRCLCSRGK